MAGARLLRRLAMSLLLGAVVLVGLPVPAYGCTCAAGAVGAVDVEALGELLTGDEVVFVGQAIENGPSDVTQVASDPPQPGRATVFDVTEVRQGNVGASVVVHSPGGPANNGNCSVGDISGLKLVVGAVGQGGTITSGACSMVPVPDSVALDAIFGPATAPDQASEVEVSVPAVAEVTSTEAEFSTETQAVDVGRWVVPMAVVAGLAGAVLVALAIRGRRAT